MNVCPFCKSRVPDPHGPCGKCGRRASEHPSIQHVQGRTIEAGFGDDGDPSVGGLDLSRGGSMAGTAGPSAYAGGGLSLGDDDDPFADEIPAASIELDVPARHAAGRAFPSGNASGSPQGPGPVPPGQGGLTDPALAPGHPGQAFPPVPLHGAPSSSVPAHAGGEASLVPRSVSPFDPRQAVRPGDASLPPHGPPPPGQGPLPGPAQPPVAPAAPDPAAMIARYPAPPAEVWEAPLYAMKVLLRQYELRQDLASLRRRRSPDVPLYERALRTHDPRTFTLGLAIAGAGLAIASFLFFLPVILRFLGSAD